MRYRSESSPFFMRSRNRYYMRHAGLRPMSSVDRPLPDNYGIALHTEPVKDELSVNDIDLNIYKNAKKHFCDRYDMTMKTDPEKKPQVPKLVVRRGFSFEVTLRLNRPYNKDKDKVAIQLAIGDRPKIPKNTLIRLPLESVAKGKSLWTVNLKSVNTNELTVELNTTANCFVGVWRLTIHITYDNGKTKVTKFEEIYLIFNPFNKDDDVYMNDPKDREEYVMNESGILYTGTCETFNHRPWSFSQFYGNILECTMYLLEASDLPYTDRGRPVLVCRRLAAMINSADDNGVLEGRWDGKYKGGIPPTKWIGSSKILAQYWKTKKTVQYGQCWVFSGILASVCRAIGIPCRSVTNYCSAHDTDSSESIDHFYNEKHEYEEYMNEDSIWNFHVWNEVYMMRPDLPVEAYSGWQVLDATPQETSDGVYSCGPCPVAAIKKGDINAKYDAPFIIAEVNADMYMWIKQKTGHYKLSSISTNRVGTALLTKRPNTMESINVINDYKYAEGSRDERAIMKRIAMSASRGQELMEKQVDDVKTEVIIDKDTMIGSDFTTKLVLKNTSSDIRTVTGNQNITTTYYTGVIVKVIFNQTINLVLQPNASETLTAVVRYSDYAPTLQEHYNLHYRCVSEVEESKQVINISNVYRLKSPELKITAPDSVKRDDMLTFTVAFTNPLPVPLTGCYLNVDGSGFSNFSVKPQKNVAVKEEFSTSVSIKPRVKGKHSIVCTFSCHQIYAVVGSHSINVEKSE